MRAGRQRCLSCMTTTSTSKQDGVVYACSTSMEFHISCRQAVAEWSRHWLTLKPCMAGITALPVWT